MSTLVVIGRVRTPHGLAGWLKVEPITHDPERFRDLDYVLAAKGNSTPERYDIEAVQFHPKQVLIKFAHIDVREDARKLTGSILKIPEDLVPPPDENEYYYYQLEGLRVENDAGEHLGTLDQIVRAGGNDVYWVLKPDGKDHHLVPATRQAIASIDLEKGVMIVNRDYVV
jgi:16S rRNA processing protein RimM